jgi:hypothetical protein
VRLENAHHQTSTIGVIFDEQDCIHALSLRRS